jgi:hypothetical protein
MPWAGDGILGQSNLQMTVTPAGETFDLEFSLHYYFCTLLTGTKVVVACPPHHGNPLTLQHQYVKLVNEAVGSVFLDIASELQHGIAIVQKAGETLMIPPFWAYMSFCVETCTSAGYFIATALKFMERMVSIDLQVATVLMWPSKIEQQAELVQYVESLALHLDVLLNQPSSFVGFKPGAVVREICNNCDRELVQAPERGMLKAQVCRLCSLIEDVGERMRVQRIWQRAWIEFLREKRKRPECRLCKVRGADMPSFDQKESVEDGILAHFVAAYWVVRLLVV